MSDQTLRHLVNVALAIQRNTGQPLSTAKEQAAKTFGVPVPTEAEFNAMLTAPPARKPVGRPRSHDLTKGQAVAAVAVYFRSIGARPEQSLVEARRWLKCSISRKVALQAITEFQATTTRDLYRASAMFAYQKMTGGTTLPLPERIDPAPRKRRGKIKSELG